MAIFFHVKAIHRRNKVSNFCQFCEFFKVCELQESVVNAVEDVLKLIEIGNRLRYECICNFVPYFYILYNLLFCGFR